MSFFDWFRKANKTEVAEGITENILLQKSLENTFEQVSEDIDKGEYYFQKGIQATQHKDYSGAITFFNKSLECADYMSMVYLNRGAVYQIQDYLLEARDDYLKALKIESSDPSDANADVVSKAKQNLAVISMHCDFADTQGESFRKQTAIDGLDYAAKRFGEIICSKMDNDKKLVYHFILEELGELDELGGDKLEFALQTGISRDKYLGAVDSDQHRPIHDECSLFFKSVLCCYSRNHSQMNEFRVSLVDQIMQIYKLGKYE